MLPAFHRGWERFTKAEDAFEVFIGGCEGAQGELETFKAEDGAAMAFEDGILAVPIGAAEVAADDEAIGFDALHSASILGRSTADTAVTHGLRNHAKKSGRRQSSSAKPAAAELALTRAERFRVGPYRNDDGEQHGGCGTSS